MSEKSDAKQGGSKALGLYLKTTRQGLEMSLRDVEVITEKQVSNAYLSQLETGKIMKPSAHVLHTLAQVYGVSYEDVMKRAGYIAAGAVGQEAGTKHGRLATFAIEHLDANEEAALREYLSFLRSKRRKDEQTRR